MAVRSASRSAIAVDTRGGTTCPAGTTAVAAVSDPDRRASAGTVLGAAFADDFEAGFEADFGAAFVAPVAGPLVLPFAPRPPEDAAVPTDGVPVGAVAADRPVVDRPDVGRVVGRGRAGGRITPWSRRGLRRPATPRRRCARRGPTGSPGRAR